MIRIVLAIFVLITLIANGFILAAIAAITFVVITFLKHDARVSVQPLIQLLW